MHQSEPGRADCDDHPSARMLGAEVRPAAMSLAHVSRSVAVNCVRRVARRSVSPYKAAIKRRFRCCSSVVEHSLGKGEVESSIPSSSTILFNELAQKKPPLNGNDLRLHVYCTDCRSGIGALEAEIDLGV